MSSQSTFSNFRALAERFAPARPNVCGSRWPKGGQSCLSLSLFLFILFLVFVPRNRLSASLQYYTNNNSIDSVVFFTDFPGSDTTTTKSDHDKQQQHRLLSGDCESEIYGRHVTRSQLFFDSIATADRWRPWGRTKRRPVWTTVSKHIR